MEKNFFSEISEHFGISFTDIAMLVDNFRKYIKETNIEDPREFLQLRKSKFKDKIKQDKLKSKLRMGIKIYIKSPLRVMKKILIDDKFYEEFINKLTENKEKIKKYSRNIHASLSMFWTEIEVAKLRSNLDNIVKKHNIESIHDLFFNRSKENMRFKRDIKIMEELAEGIPDHSPKSIYVKMKNLLNKDLYESRRWTEEETEKLLLLAKEYKPNWILIGKELNRNPKACAHKFKEINVSLGYTRNKGSWSKHESKMLRKAVRKLMNVPKYTFIFDNIPWTKVKHFVKTRSADACRFHWLFTYCCIKQDGVTSHLNDDIFFRFMSKIKKTKSKLWKLIDWNSFWLEHDKGKFSPSPISLNTFLRRYIKKHTSITVTFGTKIKKILKQLKIEDKNKVYRKK